MGAADPTYPLYPITCILASAMLLLVLTTSFVRQSWNLGVAFLCFWLFFELVTYAVNTVIWSDNANIKLYVYCDIVSHLQEITYVVKPMATLIITRRLHLIASLQSVELPSQAARHWDRAVEWTLGLIIPILVAGPIYYVNQGTRFNVYEGFGCRGADEISILDVLIQQSWTIIPPLVSIIFYLPKVARTYYQQRRDINSFLRSNSSVTRTNYFRILVLASIDILLTLPIGIVNLTLDIVQARSVNFFSFYFGWTYIHTEWEPEGYSYAELQAEGTASLAQNYFSLWSSPVLAFVIFGLFGMTPEARASYWSILCTVSGWFGWEPTLRRRNGQAASLGNIEFQYGQPRDTLGIDLEMGSRTPSFINTDVHPASQGAGRVPGGRPAREETETDLKAEEDLRRECTREAVSQDSIKYHASALEASEEPSDVVERSGTATSDDTHKVIQKPDAEENAGGNTVQSSQLDPADNADVVASAGSRATEHAAFAAV